MARPLRLEFPGALYHVTSRGDRQEAIFHTDAEREIWLAVLAEVCARFNWDVHAFCQMGNHYHLVVETIDGSLARGMRHLNGQYAQWVNRRRAIAGHLFQGRYHAILVQRDSYLLELARYVVLNPLRAGLVAALDDWRWSSCAMTCGQVRAPAWLNTDWILSQFACSRSRAVHAYRDFVLAGRGLPSPLAQTRHRLLLGDDDFVRERGRSGAELGETAKIQRRSLTCSLEDFGRRCPDRGEAMARAYLSRAFSMADIARHFDVHYKTVSRAVRLHEQAAH
ncbi:MAG TPA: transposase [Telluria sp.]|nr:transposase [Telluria sp.]